MKHLVLTLFFVACIVPATRLNAQNNNPNLQFQLEQRPYTGPLVATIYNFVGVWQGPDDLCLNETATYIVIANPGPSTDYTFSWTLPPGGGVSAIGGLNNPSIVLKANRIGSFVLQVTLTHNQSNSSKDFFKTVHVLNPQGHIERDACGTDPSLGLFWEFSLIKSGMNGISNVQWSSDQPVQFISTSMDRATANPLVAGPFEIHAAITHDCGVLHVSESYNTAECEGVFLRQAVDAHTQRMQAIQVNRGDVLPLQSQDGTMGELVIQNHLGQQITHTEINGIHRLSTSEMTAGMYFIKIHTPSTGTIQRIRLLIR